MSKQLALGLLIAGGVVLAGCTHEQFLGGNPASDDTTTQEGASMEDSTMKSGEAMEQTSYTLSEVAEHATEDDCWLAIEGKVYDVTPFIQSQAHPGGDAILEGCGKDATQLYNTRPMGSGTAHSDQARSFLPRFEIGVLETQ